MNTEKKILPCHVSLDEVVWKNGVNYRVIDHAEATAFGQKAWEILRDLKPIGPYSLEDFAKKAQPAQAGDINFDYLVLESEYFPWKYNREPKITTPPRRSDIALDAAQIDLLEDLAEKRVCGSVTAVHLEDLKKLCATARGLKKEREQLQRELDIVKGAAAKKDGECVDLGIALDHQNKRVVVLTDECKNANDAYEASFSAAAHYQKLEAEAHKAKLIIEQLYRDEVAAHERTRDVLAEREGEVLAYRAGVVKPERTTAQRIAQAKRKKAGKK